MIVYNHEKNASFTLSESIMITIVNVLGIKCYTFDLEETDSHRKVLSCS